MKGFLSSICSCILLHAVSVAEDVGIPRADVQDRILGATDVVEHVRVRDLPRDAVLTEVVVNDKVIDAKYLFEPGFRGDRYLTGLRPRGNPYVKQGLNTYRFTFHTAFGQRTVTGSYQLDTIAPTCDVDQNGIVTVVEKGSGLDRKPIVATRYVGDAFKLGPRATVEPIWQEGEISAYQLNLEEPGHAKIRVVDKAGNSATCYTPDASLSDFYVTRERVDETPQLNTVSQQATTSTVNLKDCHPRLHLVYLYESAWQSETKAHQELHETLLAARLGRGLLEQNLKDIGGYDIPGFSSEQIRTYTLDKNTTQLTQVDLRAGVGNATRGNSYSIPSADVLPIKTHLLGAERFSILDYELFPLSSVVHQEVTDAIKQDKSSAGEAWYDNDLIIYVAGAFSEQALGYADPLTGQTAVGLRSPKTLVKKSQQKIGVVTLHESLHAFGLSHPDWEYYGEYTVETNIMDSPPDWPETGPDPVLSSVQSAIALLRMCGLPRELRFVHGKDPYLEQMNHGCSGNEFSYLPASLYTTAVPPLLPGGLIAGSTAPVYAGPMGGLDFDTLPIAPTSAGQPMPVIPDFTAKIRVGLGRWPMQFCSLGERNVTYHAYQLHTEFEDGVPKKPDVTYDVAMLETPSGSGFATFEFAFFRPGFAQHLKDLFYPNPTIPLTQEEFFELLWQAQIKMTFRAPHGSELHMQVDFEGVAKMKLDLKMPDGRVVPMFGETHEWPRFHFSGEALPIIIVQNSPGRIVPDRARSDGFFAP